MKLKNSLKFIKKNALVISIFMVLVAIRFVWIDRFPPGMQYDEVEYSLSSKTFQMIGTDLSGVGFPQSLITTNTLGQVSPVPYMILAPLWFFTDLTMTTYRALYVLLNVITAASFMVLLKNLLGNKTIALIGGIIFLMNPWSIFFSRHGIDGAFVLLFYILGMNFLIKEYTKKNLFLSFLFFILGFFSYHGAKLQLLPLIVAISVYRISITPKKRRVFFPYILIISTFILAVFGFVFGGKFLESSILERRSYEFVFTNLNSFSDQVIQLRTASIETPFHSLIINKFVFGFRHMVENYLQSFSPTALFYSAEIYKYFGFFYIFEIFFVSWGALSLYLNRRKEFYLLIAILLIAPISTAVSMSGFSILNRAILMLPIFLIFISYGVYQAVQEAQRYFPKRIILFGIALLYAACFSTFIYTYFFILPIELNGHYRVPTRTLAKYLSLESAKSSKIVVVTSNPRVLYSGLVFFQPRDNQESSLRQQQMVKNPNIYTIDDIVITDECVSSLQSDTTYIIDREKVSCYKEKVPAEFMIIDKIDAGIDFSILNGKTCSKSYLTRWVSPHKISDFTIEAMDEDQFCTRWIAGSTIGVLPPKEYIHIELELNTN